MEVSVQSVELQNTLQALDLVCDHPEFGVQQNLKGTTGSNAGCRHSVPAWNVYWKLQCSFSVAALLVRRPLWGWNSCAVGAAQVIGLLGGV